MLRKGVLVKASPEVTKWVRKAVEAALDGDSIGLGIAADAIQGISKNPAPHEIQEWFKKNDGSKFAKMIVQQWLLNNGYSQFAKLIDSKTPFKVGSFVIPKPGTKPPKLGKITTKLSSDVIVVDWKGTGTEEVSITEVQVIPEWEADLMFPGNSIPKQANFAVGDMVENKDYNFQYGMVLKTAPNSSEMKIIDETKHVHVVLKKLWQHSPKKFKSPFFLFTPGQLVRKKNGGKRYVVQTVASDCLTASIMESGHVNPWEASMEVIATDSLVPGESVLPGDKVQWLGSNKQAYVETVSSSLTAFTFKTPDGSTSSDYTSKVKVVEEKPLEF